MTLTQLRLPAAAIAAVATAAGLSACTAQADESTAPTPGADAVAAEVTTQVESAFDEWNAALATGDAETVAARYAPDGVLLSTLSADIREGRDEIAGYFESDFLPKEPQGVVTESHVVVMDEDSAMHNGLYDFTVGDGEGGTTVVPARFTYVYEKIEGEWLITSHHSSVQPSTD